MPDYGVCGECGKPFVAGDQQVPVVLISELPNVYIRYFHVDCVPISADTPTVRPRRP